MFEFLEPLSLDFFDLPDVLVIGYANSLERKSGGGNHVAKIAVAYGLDVEKELASILPEEDKD